MHNQPDNTEAELVRQARLAMSDREGPGVRRDSASPRLELEGYELIREIGRGGQGIIYQAIQQSTQRFVAVKVLRNGILATHSEQSRLAREVRILAQLRHPGIVAIHDSGRTSNLSYIVMDYVEGVPLDVFVVDARPPVRELVELFAQIADAVHEAHIRGIIHRDLKPANIRIDPQGRPRVLDFGVAKLLEDESALAALTMTGQFVGSLHWSAPEQARGNQSAIDVRTDVYALGVIFWHAVCGAFPYEVTGDMGAVLKNINTAEPARWDRDRTAVPSDVETILRKCLAKEPRRRYQNAGELAGDLRNYLGGRPIAARRDSQLYVLRKTIARHWLVFGLVVLVFVIAIGSAFGFAAMYRHSERARLDVQWANQQLRRDLFSAVSSFPTMSVLREGKKEVDLFVATGSTRVEKERLFLDCRNHSASAWTLLPSRAVLRGDFDISVNYELVDFPELAGGSMAFVLLLVDLRRGTPSTWISRYYEHNPQCPGMAEHNYSSGGDGNCPPAHVPTSDMSGRLRLSRRGTTTSSYFWVDGEWRLLYSLPGSDDVMGFEIASRRILTQQSFVTAIDNFVVDTVFPAERQCLPEFMDEFAGSVIDPRLVCEDVYGSPNEAAGKLQFRKQNGYDGALGCKLDASRFVVCGDFDLRVDFQLIDFPDAPDGRHYVRLGIIDPANGQVVGGLERVRESEGTAPAHNYLRSFLEAHEQRMKSSAANGTLIAIRRGREIEFAFVEDESHQVGRFPIFDGPVAFELRSGSTDETRPHVVHLDNLRLAPMHIDNDADQWN